MEKKIPSIYTLSVAAWFDFYRSKTGQEYVFDGQQGKHLKMLIKKIEMKVKQKGMEPTEDNIINSFKGLLFSMNDQWVLDHLEISIVNSKFNIIYGKAIKNNPFTRAEQYSDFAKRKFGSGS